jgi:hypothetical protein
MVVSGSLTASPLTISPNWDGSVVVSANGMTATLRPRVGANGAIEMAIEVRASFPAMPPVVYRGGGDFVSPNNAHKESVVYYSDKTVAR